VAGTSYPKVGSAAWRQLRARAASTPSTKFTSPYVATLLNMGTPDSAANNVVLPMRRLGLLEEDGSLSALGQKWRNDSTYAEACQEILDAVYPDELASLTDGGGRPDKALVATWLQHQGLGESNARQMAATYVLIASKEISNGTTAESDSGGGRRRPQKTAVKGKKSSSKNGSIEAPRVPEEEEEQRREDSQNSGFPNVHLDIQIHIPATATPDQIDQIFASMARHLYQR
jgi:hypothetical protein